MRSQGIGRTLRNGAILAVLLAQVGCLHLSNQVIPPPPSEVAPALTVGQCQKNRVYLFFLQGCDLLDCSDFGGLVGYAQSLGFIKTHWGYTFHAFHFSREIKKLRKEHPDARFVLIGQGHGAPMAREVAASACGIEIDLLLYLDGVEGTDGCLDRPANVLRVVNVLSKHRGNSHIVQEAENHRFTDVGAAAIPTDKRTLLLLAHELAEVARRVPITQKVHPVDVVPGPVQIPGQLPAPRELSGKPDGWDFLLPDPYTQLAPGMKPADQALRANPATTAGRQ